MFFMMQWMFIVICLLLIATEAFVPSTCRWQVVTSSLNAEIGKSKGELMKEYTPPQKDDIKEAFKNNATYTLGKDDQGYDIKEEGWFQGLSGALGDSINDKRVVPVPAKEFAEKVIAGTPVTFKETMDIIDTYYNYFEVPFSNGDLISKPNENVGSAKIFSFGLLTRMDEKAVLGCFGEIARDLTPEGTDHMNIRNFMKTGWSGIKFEKGLAIASKTVTFDNTDDAIESQGNLVEGDDELSFDSESWIP